MPKDHAQKGCNARSGLERNVQNRLLEASKKVPTAKKWMFTEDTATFPYNSRLNDLQSPVPTLEDLKKWTVDELKLCVARLDNGSLKAVSVSIHSFATKESPISKASEKFSKESLADQRSKLTSLAYIRIRNMISKVTGVPLCELGDINPLNDHATYRWVFSDNYPAFPTRDLTKMSMDHLKQCTTALKSGEVTVKKCSDFDLESNTNDKDFLPDNPSRSQDNRMKQPVNSRKTLIEDTEKKLRSAVSKCRSKALTEASLVILLNEGSIPHPQDGNRTYRWRFTNSYPCFPSSRRNIWEWKSVDLIKTGEAIDKHLLSFELEVPEQILESTDRLISKIPSTQNESVPSKYVTEMNEASANTLPTAPPFSIRIADKSTQSPGATKQFRDPLQKPTQPIPSAISRLPHDRLQNKSSHIQAPGTLLTSTSMSVRGQHDEVVGPFLEHASHTRLPSTAIRWSDSRTSPNTMDLSSGGSLIKEIEDFVAREETLKNSVEDQVRTLMEEFRTSTATRKSQLSELSAQFVTLRCSVQTHKSEISRLQKQLDEEISNAGAAKRELLELKSEKDLWAKRTDEERKKAREEGQREALEHEHRRQSSIQSAASLVQLQEIQRERDKAFEEGQESARQSMSANFQLLNEALTKAKAEIERLRCGSTEAIDETVNKIAKSHDCDDDRSKHEIRAIVTNWRVNENFFYENKVIPLGMRASTGFFRFLAKLSKEVSDHLIALDLLRAAMEWRIQNCAAPQPSYITEYDVKKTLEQLEYRHSNSIVSTPTNFNPPTALPCSGQLKPLTPQPSLQTVIVTSSVSCKSESRTQTPKSPGCLVAGIKRASVFDEDDDIYGLSPPRMKRPAHHDKVSEMVERNRVHHGVLDGGERL